MEDPLGLKTHRTREERDTHRLGDTTVTATTRTDNDSEPRKSFQIAFYRATKFDSLDNLNIHQLRDLRTLLNHILGEEGS